MIGGWDVAAGLVGQAGGPAANCDERKHETHTGYRG